MNTKIMMLLPFALAACAAQPEPIQDYNAPLGKYEVAAPLITQSVIEANDNACAGNAAYDATGNLAYRTGVPKECLHINDRDGGTPRVLTTPTPPPPSEPPTGKPPHEKPPTGKPPHEKPPSTERAKKNNGLGNGDQPAPGRSLNRNRAENQVGNPGHNSGKPQNSD